VTRRRLRCQRCGTRAAFTVQGAEARRPGLLCEDCVWTVADRKAVVITPLGTALKPKAPAVVRAPRDVPPG